MPRSVAVVAHSHWDREWYAPFESYQARLVKMVDGLIDLLEGDPEFTHFHLDGQAAVVDDYLELRPERAQRLARLAGSGRLGIGPWYVLMDEFCVSAETIVRNLQLGLDRTASLGATPACGYLPDMFGHVAQMPQILRQAGLEHALVWRGVPGGVRRTAFWWEAPDGSRVRAEVLPVGYANGAFLPARPEDLLRRLDAHEREIEPLLGAGWPILLMNGGDHHHPQAGMPRLLATANRCRSGFDLRQRSLGEYLASAPTDGLDRWRGELRSGARSPILMGVLSSRVDIKQAAARAERALERMAEPLAALWQPAEAWPEGALALAWKEVIRNSAHDSVCGCSADEVGRAVLGRYDSALSVADSVVDDATGVASLAIGRAGVVVINSLHRERLGVVEMDLPGTSAPDGTQQLWAVPAGTTERRGRGCDLASLLGGLAADGWVGPGGRVVAAVTSETADGVLVDLEHDPCGVAGPDMPSAVAEMWAVAGAAGDRPLRVRVTRRASQRVAALAGPVPGWGWSVWDTRPPAAAPVTVSVPAVGAGTAGGGTVSMDNGLVRVELDMVSGTFSLDGVAGQNLIVEEGDAGDTYNFCPVPGGEAEIASPVEVGVEPLERGPVRAAVRVRRIYHWPARTGPAGRYGRERVAVVSDVELRSGEASVRVTTTVDHRGGDRRVRAVFPLPVAAQATVAECAFASVTRSRAEGGPLEAPQSTFPSRRFVTAGELTLTHEGLLEHELLDGGSTLAVTLMRATGIISRPHLSTRPNIAGPPLAVPGNQLPGPRIFRYALARCCPDPWRLADELWTPLAVTLSSGTGHLDARGSRLSVRGAQVSSLRRRDGAIELRVFNPAPTPATVEVGGHSGTLVDLTGRPVADWAGQFQLGPWQFATARLSRRSLD